jgi:hypothetical protein
VARGAACCPGLLCGTLRRQQLLLLCLYCCQGGHADAARQQQSLEHSLDVLLQQTGQEHFKDHRRLWEHLLRCCKLFLG